MDHRDGELSDRTGLELRGRDSFCFISGCNIISFTKSGRIKALVGDKRQQKVRKGRGEAGAGGELLHPTPLPGGFPAKIQPGGLSESVMHQEQQERHKRRSASVLTPRL